MAEILVIDDEKEMLGACANILQAFGHETVLKSGAEQAIESMRVQNFDLILCDLFMPEIDGMQVLARAQQFAPQTPVIMFTAYGTIERAVAAMKAGAFDFIEKPFEAEELQIVLEKGLRQRRLFQEKADLQQQLDSKYKLDNLIGCSAKMQRVFDMIRTVARSDANVIITGESGTGKELVARSIHALSSRHTKPFMPVNCGALPENLFESELFGYEKGAFTGAARRKPGLLEMANGGAFFLDEVCELTEALQVKLLRVLQDRQVRRLGGDKLVEVDVHYIAATNRDVEALVKSGRLREDFYYRLNVMRLDIPPLRKRRSDIRPLAEHFLQRYLKSSPKKVAGFNNEVFNCLEKYDWPGNVRELENTVERALALTKGETITVADLPDHLQALDSPAVPLSEVSLVEAKKRMIEDLEKKYLLTLLRQHRGNVTKIAVAAGMTRRNLHRLLKQYGLKAEAWRKD